MRTSSLWLTWILSLGCAVGLHSATPNLPDPQRGDSAFEAFLRQDQQAFQEYLRADSIAFEQFKQEVLRKWQDFVRSTRKTWVEYGDDLDSRTSVDFQKGEATVEVILPRRDAERNAKLADDLLRRAIRDLLTSRGKSMDYKVKDQEPEPLSDKPALSGQVEMPTGERVTPQNAEQFAKVIVDSLGSIKKTYKSRDGVERVNVSLTFELVPDHLRIRAERYVEDVWAYSSRYDLDPQLVFAIIHTESYFNPKAQSPAPAYGLMQIVPHAAGAEAYRYIYERDYVPTPDYLFNARNNIELGCTYLHLLSEKYFTEVKNPETRRYTVIAAYNTGPGNVYRAFDSRGKIEVAVNELNRLDSDEAYTRLASNLPFQETKDYLAKVLERIPLYSEWRLPRRAKEKEDSRKTE